jgi:RimJ/RimL family protein N-acetyltransferase
MDLKEDFYNKLSHSLNENKIIKKYFDTLSVSGTGPWDLTIEVNWKDIGKIRISSFDLSDIWALRDWWNGSLSYNSKGSFPLFPSSAKLERCIANHLKNHESRRDIIFNVWLLKEGNLNEDFDNEIIGHFYLQRCRTRPEIGLGVSDRYQSKGLGKLFIMILIYITKNLGHETIYLGVDKGNVVGIDLYKRLGFLQKEDIDIYIPVTDYTGTVSEMELDIKNYT